MAFPRRVVTGYDDQGRSVFESDGAPMATVRAGDTVMATSTRLFQGRVVADSADKKGESLLASTPVVVLSSILGRTPTIAEYKAAVSGIKLTEFAPPNKELSAPSR